MTIVISIAAVIALATLAVGGYYLLAPKTDPLYVAHQGYRSEYLGNTKSAFLAATEKAFYGIETDVRKTKDGYYVCNHDATVKYADGTELAVAENDRSALTAKPLLNDKTKDAEYLCTFEDYLDICKEGGKVAVIELKADFGTDEIRELLRIVDERYSRVQVSFISFYYDTLLRIKAEDPTCFLQYLSETKNDPIFDRCLEDGISLDVKQTILTKKLVKKCNARGLAVNVWTVNKSSDLSAARRAGVSFVTTDVFDK